MRICVRLPPLSPMMAWLGAGGWRSLGPNNQLNMPTMTAQSVAESITNEHIDESLAGGEESMAESVASMVVEGGSAVDGAAQVRCLHPLPLRQFTACAGGR